MTWECCDPALDLVDPKSLPPSLELLNDPSGPAKCYVRGDATLWQRCVLFKNGLAGSVVIRRAWSQCPVLLARWLVERGPCRCTSGALLYRTCRSRPTELRSYHAQSRMSRRTMNIIWQPL